MSFNSFKTLDQYARDTFLSSIHKQGLKQPTGTATDTGVANGFTKSGLTESTDYEYYVQADCGGGDTSVWVGPYSFTTVCGFTDVPFVEDFETGANCGLIVNEGSGNSWGIVSTSSYGFSADHLRYAWNSSNSANTWFFTQGINLEAGVDYTLVYDYGGTGTSFPEKLKVAYGTSASAVAMTNEIADYPSVVNDSPITESISITVPADGVYYFGFQCYSDADQFYLHLDNISIDFALSTDGFDKEAVFTYYPNPVNNNLTLSAQKEINNVSVYNMVGQEVFRNVPNAMTEVVDMSSLQAGAYFVKVTIGNATKTVKVIKN